MDEEVFSSQILFEEVEVAGEVYCLVPKSLVPYVPTKPVTVQYLEGIGAVEIGNNYLYIEAGLFPENIRCHQQEC